MKFFAGSSTYSKSIVLAVLIAIGLLTPSAAAATLDGFVTNVVSRTEFQVSGLHVVVGATTQCFTEKLEPNIEPLAETHWGFTYQWYLGFRERSDSRSLTRIPCSEISLATGSHVRVTGDVGGSGRPFPAVQVTVYTVTIRPDFGTGYSPEEWDGGALIEERPQVERTTKGWRGTLWLDGYPMSVSPETVLATAPPGTEMTYRSFGGRTPPQWRAVMPQGPLPAFTESLFKPDTWAAYTGVSVSENDSGGKSEGGDVVQPAARGTFLASGDVILAQARLWPNQVSVGETKYVADLTPLVRTPNYARHIAGSIRFQGDRAQRNLRILPDDRVQELISRIGTSLIPAYQKKLLDENGTRVHFRFYVVQGERPNNDDEMSQTAGLPVLSLRDIDRGMVAFPNGLVVIADYVLARIDNEAQLATVLSSAISSVIQKQGFIRQGARPGDPTVDDCELCSGPNLSALLFPLLLNEQALRIGIRQMYLAGYDIREAPFAWTVAAGRPMANPINGSAGTNKEIPWEVAYAFNYISQFYSDVDYGKLKRGRAEYGQLLKELRHADPEAFEQSRK